MGEPLDTPGDLSLGLAVAQRRKPIGEPAVFDNLEHVVSVAHGLHDRKRVIALRPATSTAERMFVDKPPWSYGNTV